MTIDETMKKLEKLTKTELLDLIELMMKKNDNNHQLINNKLGNKNPKSKTIEKQIIKSFNSNQSYYEAYFIYKNYVDASTDNESILEVSRTLLGYLVDELEDCGLSCPTALYETTIEIYEVALKSAYELKDLEAAEELHGLIGLDYDGVFEGFLDVFYSYFDIDDEDNVILYVEE